MTPFTRAAIGYQGPTTVLTARVARPVAEFIDAQVGREGFVTRSDVVQHALAVWCLAEEAKMARNGHD